MKKHPIFVSLLSVGLSIIGFIFSNKFQDMAYWWGAPKSLLYYWVGAGLSYAFSVAAILVIFIRSFNFGWLVVGIRVIGVGISIISILWTTFVIIAWQSGF